MTRAAIILCGGLSTRMGLDKARLPFGPETMLQRVVRLVAPRVEKVVVVASPGQELPDLPDAVEIAHDRREGRGPLEGLAAGLRVLEGRADAVFATSCDVPLLEPAFVSRMFELLGEHEIAVPRDGKFHHPLAAAYRVGVLSHVEQLLAEDRLRPFFLFAKADTLEVPVESLRDVDPQLATLENINQPEEYQTALRQAGF